MKNDTLAYILKKYKVNRAPIIYLPYSRFDEYPTLLFELGAKRGVEVGVYKGQYCETLCRFIPGLDLTGVDLWMKYEGYNDYSADDLVSGFDQASERADKFGFKLLRTWSTMAVEQFENNSLDFVFLDAGHDFWNIASDINEWSSKVKSGGIVSGHDYCLVKKRGWAVKAVVDAWCDVNEIEPLLVFNLDKWATWMYVK